MAPKAKYDTLQDETTKLVKNSKEHLQNSLKKDSMGTQKKKTNSVDKENETWWGNWIGENDQFPPTMLCNISGLKNVEESEASEPNEYHGPKYDYPAMHALLIEALLDEQNPYEPSELNSPNSSIVSSETDPLQNRVDLDISPSLISSHKRNKLSNSRRKRLRSVEAMPIIYNLPAEAIDSHTLSSVTSSLSMSSTSSLLPSPGSFLSENCKLQKDKGSGLKPGTATTIFGKEGVLKKLRNKTNILGQAVSSPNQNMSNDEVLSQASKRSSSPWGMLKPTGKAEMRRGPVKLTGMNPPETRSILEMKMGFLSIKYGILLHWNKDDGLADLVVMRKMVTKGFMDVKSVDLSKFTQRPKPKPKATTKREKFQQNPNQTPRTKNTSSARIQNKKISFPPSGDKQTIKREESNRSLDQTPALEERTHSIKAIQRDVDEDSVDMSSLENEDSRYSVSNMLQGTDGYNVIAEQAKNNNGEHPRSSFCDSPVLEPPYLVSRPDHFPPSSLSVTVLRARGLVHKKKNISTYVRLSTKGDSYRTGVIKMSRNPVWTERDNNYCTLSIDDKKDDVLEVRICLKRQLVKDQVISVIYVPLELVEPHRKAGLAPTEVTIPCKMEGKKGPYGSITLALNFQSFHRWWLNEEIRAREKRNTDPLENTVVEEAEAEMTNNEKERLIEEEEEETLTTFWFCCYY